MTSWLSTASAALSDPATDSYLDAGLFFAKASGNPGSSAMVSGTFNKHHDSSKSSQGIVCYGVPAAVLQLEAPVA